MYNQSPQPNPDGMDAIPDVIVCNGPAYQADLEGFGIPPERLKIGGAFRFAPTRPADYDPEGPIFAALSSNADAARQMVQAVQSVARNRRRFLVKAHPMYPHKVQESEYMKVTKAPLSEQGGLAGVLYCASVVGLEAALAGLPTVRFLTEGSVAMDVLPAAIDLPTAEAETLAKTLNNLEAPPPIDWYSIFADVDMAIWHDVLGAAEIDGE